MSLDFLPEYTTLDVSLDKHIAHIQLSRPDKLNSMIETFWHELPNCIELLDTHAVARVIVLSSKGKHFSAGMDLSVFENMAKAYSGEPARRAERSRRHILGLQDAFTALEATRIPVLAAVQGGAIGGAVDMLCACDSRYCTQDAFFCIKETQLGMTADVGTLQRIGGLMSHGMVRELVYTGRNMHADEALKHGFVNQVFEDHDTMLRSVFEIAEQIAQNSPIAVAGSKEMLNYARDNSVKDSLNYMATWQSGMLQMPDVFEAMNAGKEGRQAQFDNLHPSPKKL